MDIGENLGHSFKYVKKLTSDAGRLVILIVLNLIPIVNWIVIGYYARVLRESPVNQTLPRLERYGELFVDGAKVSIASLIYMLIPTILIVVGAASLFASFFTQGNFVAPTMLLGGAGAVFLLVGIILAIILLIFLGVGIAHMIKTTKFGKAFAFGEILGIIRRIGWLKYLGWIIVVLVISVVVGAVTGAVPVIGWIISVIIQPFLGVLFSRSLGILYNEGAPPELQSQPMAMGQLVCSSCGTPLQPQHKFCPNCGAAAPAPFTPPPPPIPAMGETKNCVACGAQIPASANFCGTCGAKQS